MTRAMTDEGAYLFYLLDCYIAQLYMYIAVLYVGDKNNKYVFLSNYSYTLVGEPLGQNVNINPFNPACALRHIFGVF